MKPVPVLAVFDSHTPYLAFRLNALHEELNRRGLDKSIDLQVVLIGAEEKSYSWDGDGLQALYQPQLHILSEQFRGLGLKKLFHPSVGPCLWRLGKILFRLRPKILFVGGYDRPESIFSSIVSRLWGGKTGVWNDSKFSDAEEFGKSAWREAIKSLIVSRFHFFLCPGRESADYHRFLGGEKKLALTSAWDVVDNEGIAKLADDSSADSEIFEALDIEKGERFFLMPVRFIEKKNIPLVLSSFAKYRIETDSPLPLAICGKGPLEESIRKQIDQLELKDSVKLVSWLPYERVPRACRLSQCLLLASTHDQWGMTVNEALAAGAPVLVSNRCGSHEVVKNHVNGYTFDPYDGEHLTQLFRFLSEDQDLVDRLRDNAAESVATFSIKEWVTQHLLVLEHYSVLPEGTTLETKPPASDPE